MKGTDRVTRSHVRGWLLAAALAVALNAHAAKTFPGFLAEVQGQSTTVAAASNGTLVATRAPGTLQAGGGWTLAGNYGVAVGAAAGDVKVGADTVLTVAGKGVPTQVAGNISKADLAAAVAGCFGATLVGCSIGAAAIAAPYALSWLTANNVRPSPTTPGGLEGVPVGCYIAPCYEYQALPLGNNEWIRDHRPACDAWAARATSTGYKGPGVVVTITGSNEGGRCNYTLSSGGGSSLDMSRRNATPLSPTWAPTTPQEVKDKLIAGSAVPNPLIVPELEKTGVDWNANWKSPVVTGPAQVKGPEKVTTNPDGSTKTEQATTPLTYSGPKVTAGPTTTTTIDRNSSGTTTSTTTSVQNPGTEATPLPPGTPAEEEKETKLQCDDDKYPNSLGCIEVGEPVMEEIPKETKTITYAPETPFGGGSCPADRYFNSTLAGGQSFKAVDWAQWCSYGASTIRPLILLLAGISAFFIVALGKDAEA